MSVKELLQELGNQFGIPDFEPNEEGTCSLSFDNRLTITFEVDEEENCFYVYETIGTIPVEQTTGAYTTLLQANYFGQQTGQAFFSISPDTDEVYLMQRFIQNDALSFEDFYASMENFVRHLDYWQNQFTSGELLGASEIDGEETPSLPNTSTHVIRA